MPREEHYTEGEGAARTAKEAIIKTTQKPWGHFDPKINSVFCRNSFS